ncbi:TonB-dependent siderophore receptor [Pseudomonas moraviensis]|uniref:TonB-dependent siderophore receptor n=1 Tax=Pseudomonas moraviensis TaxID=321662 RepID=A0A2A2PLF6_9PSED|nr:MULTISPECIES: TonB-dependent siderophore receptor [Pseudomonas fluorescens group]PAW56055.1 TonB-dependent siderophore receptor [Pseudomonas moraviensis]PAW59544.1 TonB-dependent siderophore receptor [Pseudomonas moraviensis]
MPAPFSLTPVTLGLSAVLSSGFAYSATELPATAISAEEQAEDPRVKISTTATRTMTPVRYVPQAIDSIKTSNVADYGTNDIGDALSGIPNVSSSADTRFDSLRIRGFDASNDFYLDGIRDDSQYKRDLHNIERVEVLKGPAAVLYGRGSQGGIVNRVSKLPEFGRRSTIEAQGGSEDLRSLYADLSTDPSENLSLRLNMGNMDENSFRDGVSGNRQLFAPSMSWQLTPDLNWLVQYEYSRYNRTPDRGIPGVNGRPAGVSRETTYGNDHDFIDDKAQSLRSKLTYEINDNWQLRQTLGVFKLDSDFDNTYLTSFDPKTNKVARQHWQQDLTTRNVYNNLELEGGFDTFGLEHRLLTGVEIGSQRRDPKLYNAATGRTQGAQPVPSLDLFNPNRELRHTGSMQVFSDSHTEVESRAVYVQDQLRLNEQWQLLAGLRYDTFDIESTNQLKNLTEDRDSHSTSPRFGIVWTPLQNHSFYASWSKTFSPVGGGLIGITPGAAGNSNDLSPELTKQKEIGVKSDWLDDRLSTTLAVYDLELYNRRTSDPNDPTLTVMTGLQRSRGVELTATGKLVGNWYMRGGVGVQDTTIEKDNNGLEGKRVNNVAKHNGSLFLTWKPEMGWYGETGLTLVGQRYADNANTTVLPGYGRWDALLGYRFKDWDLRAALNNITDREYYASATSQYQIQPGAPRSVVMTGTYSF